MIREWSVGLIPNVKGHASRPSTPFQLRCLQFRDARMGYRDITGEKFGKLTPIKPIFGRRNTFWHCLCDCGNEKEVVQFNLKNGHTRSCGCLKKIKHCITHGKTDSRVYRIWSNMKTRCVNENSISYPNYGGRGIGFDDRWNDFQNFLDDMGEPESDDLQLDRIDNDGDYCKENCRWADSKTQANNRRTNRRIKIGSETKTMAEWAEDRNIRFGTISERFRRGWSDYDSIMKPVRPHKQYRRQNHG